MTSPLRLRPDGPQWPYSFAQLRQDEPQLSISNAPHAGEIASWLALDPPIVILTPEPTEQPSQDGYQAVELMPELVDGQWRQAWELQPLPPVEPQPDWPQFRQALVSENGYFEAFVAIGAVNPMLTGPLSARLDRFQFEGQWQPFLESLAAALAALPDNPADPTLSAGHIATELLALAGRCDLPLAFREALQAMFEQ